jgi:DNA repair protein RecN (Recombination protein N)
VTLALAREVAKADDVPIMLLDEIDQNVGGRLGTALGSVLTDLAASRQVIAITHLPSVAALGGAHVMVEKTRASGTTAARLLENGEREREIAAMIGGEPITDAALAEARDLRSRSCKASQRAPRRVGRRRLSEARAP